MKVIVRDSLGPIGFLASNETENQFRLNVRSFAKDTFLTTEPALWEIDQQLEMMDLAVRAKIQVIQESKLTFGKPRDGIAEEANLQRSSDGESPLVDLMSSDDFISASLEHNAVVVAGEDRQKLFQRKLGYLLPYVSEVTYLDHFFYEQLEGDDGAGAWFFLEQCILNEVSQINIRCTSLVKRQPENKHLVRTPKDFLANSKINLVASKISALKAKYGSHARIRLSVYPKLNFRDRSNNPLASLPHDRFGSLMPRHEGSSLSNNLIYFFIGPGVGIFGQEKVQYSLSLFDEFDLKDPVYLDQIAENAKPLYDSVF